MSALFASHTSFAQKSSDYVPPALFDTPPVPPKDVNTHSSRGKSYTPPSVSGKKSQPKDAELDPGFKPYVPNIAPPPMDPEPIDQTPAQRGIVVQNVLPMTLPPLPAQKPVITPAKPQPIIASVSEKVPKEEEKAKVSKGVVTGPKTMPALPARQIEAVEQTFETQNTGDGAVMERFQKQVKQTSSISQDTEQEATIPAQFKLVKDTELLRAEIRYPSQKADIPETMTTFINELSHYLRAHPAKKLDILGFAASTDGNEIEDKRLSLARALNIRQHLVDQNIATERINVRALGRKTDQPFKDRVDLYIRN